MTLKKCHICDSPFFPGLASNTSKGFYDPEACKRCNQAGLTNSN